MIGTNKSEVNIEKDNSKKETISTESNKLITAPPVSRFVKSPSIRASSSSSSSSTTTTTTTTTSHHNNNTSQLLWVDKYKPQRLDDIVGAGESARKILDWLKKWPDVHLKKTLKVN